MPCSLSDVDQQLSIKRCSRVVHTYCLNIVQVKNYYVCWALHLIPKHGSSSLSSKWWRTYYKYCKHFRGKLTLSRWQTISNTRWHAWPQDQSHFRVSLRCLSVLTFWACFSAILNSERQVMLQSTTVMLKPLSCGPPQAASFYRCWKISKNPLIWEENITEIVKSEEKQEQK